MKLLKYSLITFVWVAITGFSSTSAEPRFDKLLDNKLDELIYYSNDITKTVVEYKGDDIVELQKIIDDTKHKSILDKIDKIQNATIKKCRCLWSKIQEKYRREFFEFALTSSDKQYKEFKILLHNLQDGDLNLVNFTEFSDAMFFNYKTFSTMNPFMTSMTTTWSKYIPTFFYQLITAYEPNPQCHIESVEKLFVDMATLLGSSLTKDYIIILVSLRARHMPQLRTIPSLNYLITHLNLDTPEGYEIEIQQLQQKYIEEMEIIRKELYNTFDS